MGAFGVEFLLCFRFGAGVERADVSHADLCEDGVAFFHFIDGPAEGEENAFWVCDDGDDEVREGVVHLHLDDFGVDHDEAEILWAEAVEDGGDDGVDADAFPGAGCACDEAVGHCGEVADDGFAVDIFSEGDGDLAFGAGEVLGFEQFAEGDFLFFRVGDLDSDGVFAGDGGEDVDTFCAGGAGDVFFESDDPIHADAFGGVDLVAGDGGASGDVTWGDVDPELLQGIDDGVLDGEEFFWVGCFAVFEVWRIEQVEGGQFVVFAMDGCEWA